MMRAARAVPNGQYPADANDARLSPDRQYSPDADDARLPGYFRTGSILI